MRKAQIAGAAGALLAVSVMVLTTSTAAFTATTDNSGNSWTAGTVVLSDDDTGTALFAESGLVPGSTGERCIVVTYDGDVAAAVVLYGATTGGTGLGDYLDVVVERGTGGAGGGDCTGFASTETLHTGTLTALTTAATGYASGLGSWAPTGAAQTATYRFSWTLQDTDAAQGKDVTATFTWEAQNT